MPVWTGTKKGLCAECIQALGVDVTYTVAKKWCKNHYGQEVSEPQFYTVRRIMTDALQAVSNPEQRPAPWSAKVQAKFTQDAPTKNSIADLVKATKALVDKLGKEEAKNLIDAL